MSALADLIRWIITYAVTGGFWHFVAVLLIVNAIARIAHFVRVTVNVKRKTKDKAATS